MTGPTINTHTEPGILHAARGASDAITTHADSAIRRGAQHQRAVTAEQNRDIAIGPRGRDDWGAGTADGSPVLGDGEFAKAGSG